MKASQDASTPMEVRSDEEARDKVLAIAAEARTAMFCTYDETGTAHGRPMVAVEQRDGTLWFFTRAESRKVDEIRADPRVTLTYEAAKENDWLSLQGRAAVVRDAALAKDLWSEPLRTWFPEGPEDDAVALIRVEPVSAEYWDSPSGLVVFGYGYAKAALTGEPPELGDVAQVKM